MSIVYIHRKAIYSRYINNYVESVPYIGRCLSYTAFTFYELKIALLLTLIVSFLIHTIANYILTLNKDLFSLLSIGIVFWLILSFFIGILLLRVLLLYEEFTILPFE